MFYVCSIAGMMIEPDSDEVEMVIAIAIQTAPAYAIRKVFSERNKLDRQVAVATLVDRIARGLAHYEMRREARPHEMAEGTGVLPLFPDERR